MSSSSQCCAVFPEELMIEILSRVSVKDLMRYRCISKWMNHLVLDHSHYVDDCEDFWVRFWNPSTRLMSEDSPCVRFPSDDSFIFGFGFGYDDWSDTYQVVFLDNKSEKMEVSVHSLGDSCWRNVLSCDALETLSLYGVYVCGTINWLALPKSESGFDYGWRDVTMNEIKILSYDVKNEKCNYLSMPDFHCEVPHDEPVIQVFKGCLCLSHRQGTQLFVCTMREFGVAKSWTPLLNINYEDLDIHVLHGMPTIPMILCISENDDVLLLGSYNSAEFFLYNKKDNRIDR
ncbi:F-box/kelch-repeat protein At3g23880-like [Phaseolus vulgaris]|uniref:F-box/kelch-repeat protein At3g23880-like n=1 Tax=Phaseolus vulgaris TaxID=3885 RepID=UPI0035CBF1F9